jgi:uncharacterized protein with von Willebrand factor type A (vWA) domain
VPFVQSALLKAEQQLKAEHPKLYEVYMQFHLMKNNMQEVQEKLQFSYEQLNNLKRYNAILRSEEEMRRILEFYHREYEVLPLWYKRFGHILKVLTGKRSLKSLLDDREKKIT